MKTRTRKHIHMWLAVFFALQIPVAAYLYLFAPDAWQKIAVLYLVLVSQWALVASHLSGASAETPD